MIIWTDQETELLKILRPICSTREIVEIFTGLQLERSMSAISNKARSMEIEFKDFGLPDKTLLTEEQIPVIDSVVKNRELHFSSISPPTLLTDNNYKKNTIVKETTAGLLLELHEIRETIPRTSSVSTLKSSSKKQSLCLAISDLHIGKISRDVDDYVTYNMDIGINRILSTTENLLSTLSKDNLKGIDEVVFLMLGDNIDGEQIYPGQDVSIERHVVHQVKVVTKAIWQLILDMKKLFPFVRIVTTRGNHGRSGLSPEANWDNIVYQELELLTDLTNNPQLTIRNKYGEFNTCEVKGHRLLIRHNAPIQCETPATRGKLGGWYNIHKFNGLVYGHWHHWGTSSWNETFILRNGALCGGDDYAETFGCGDLPNQVAFIVNEEKLPTLVVPLVYK